MNLARGMGEQLFVKMSSRRDQPEDASAVPRYSSS